MFPIGGSLQSGYIYKGSKTSMPQYSESTLNKSSVHEKTLGITQVLTDVPKEKTSVELVLERPSGNSSQLPEKQCPIIPKEITSDEPVLERPDCNFQLPGKPMNDDTDSAEVAPNAFDKPKESINEEPLSLMQMADYLKSQGYITDDIFQTILQAPLDKQTLKLAFKVAKKKNQNNIKEIIANRGDDSCQPLLQQLNALTCEICKQCKILNCYKKELKSLENLDMVYQLCEEASVFEFTGDRRSAKELLKALRIAVHNHFKKLEAFADILKESGNLDLFKLIWNDYCTAFGIQVNDNTSDEGRGLEEPTEQT